VVPIGGRLDPGIPVIDALSFSGIRPRILVCRTGEVPVSLHDHVPLEVELGIV
jgi:hypothetical protein